MKEKILVVRTAARLAATVAAVQDGLPDSEVAGLAIAATRQLAVAAAELPQADERVVFTSAEAVRWFPADTVRGCWCVGEVTAAAARRAGWQVLGVCGAGVAHALADEMGLGRPQKWVHWRAANGLTGWHESLRLAGHTLREVVGYESVFTAALPAELQHQQFTRTLVMSAASAAHLRQLREQVKLPVEGTAYVPSLAVQAAAAQGFANVVVAQQPTFASVLAALKAA